MRVKTGTNFLAENMWTCPRDLHNNIFKIKIFKVLSQNFSSKLFLTSKIMGNFSSPFSCMFSNIRSNAPLLFCYEKGVSNSRDL